MKILLTTLCLTIAVLLGSVGESFSADLKKGFDAFTSGDFVTALRELKPLAEQGVPDAQHLLGFIYLNGKKHGIPEDIVSSYMWLSIAGSSWAPGDALERREFIARRMSASQIKEAQERTTECIRKKFKGC